MNDPRAQLPAVHRLITDELSARYGARRVTVAAQHVLDDARAHANAGVPSADVLGQRVHDRLQRGVAAAINATGVVLHTNLGRAPWSARAIERAMSVAGYCTLEIERTTGQRGGRGSGVEDRLRALTGAEAALVVNNCAAAVLLCLRELAPGKQVLVSRGELVEIGGGFRVPEILEQSGAKLVEVGTTNRTHLRDFQQALSPDVGAILRVHHSNFRQEGFVAQPALQDLAKLGPPLIVDLGSGALQPMGDEPTVAEQLAAGADLVCFSGDKLIGGPQAGIVVGGMERIEQLRKQPLMRAFRADKVILAALEATLDDWLLGELPPVQAMIEAPVGQLQQAVEAWQSRLPDGVQAQPLHVDAAIGGGSMPGHDRASVALAISTPKPEALQKALLLGEPPIFARIHDGRLLLDARTVIPVGQGDALIDGLLVALRRVVP